MGELTILTGCFGSGKSEIAIQLALNAAGTQPRVCLLDLDLINPYFKSSASRTGLEQAGVRVIAPLYAGSGIEAPSLPPEMGAAIADDSITRIVDLGGDSAGATVLGSFARRILESNYRFLYVHNPYRPYTADAPAALELLKQLERRSRLQATGIINNANLMGETQPEHLLHGDEQCAQLAKLSGLPVAYHCLPAWLEGENMQLAGQKLLLTLDNRPAFV